MEVIVRVRRGSSEPRRYDGEGIKLEPGEYPVRIVNVKQINGGDVLVNTTLNSVIVDGKEYA